MEKHIHIFVATLLVLLVSCQGQQKTEAPLWMATPPVITDYEIVYHPNAPTRITRKVRQDQDGNLIIAGYDEIIRYDGTTFTNFTKDHGLDTCFAFDVLEDRNRNVWIADDQIGAFRYDVSTEEFTHFTVADGLGYRRNMCIYEDRSGNIWIGGGNGASRYDGKTFQNFTIPEGTHHNDISVILEDRAGKIWLGTRGDAFYLDPSAKTETSAGSFTRITNDEGKPFQNVWSILEDTQGNIWLGGEGVWRYDGTSFTKISNGFVAYIYQDQKGNIWTTQPQGLLTRYDVKELSKRLPIGVPIFRDQWAFLGITEDKEGNIWFGGRDGIWRYDGQAMTYFTGKPQKDE